MTILKISDRIINLVAPGRAAETTQPLTKYLLSEKVAAIFTTVRLGQLAQ